MNESRSRIVVAVGGDDVEAMMHFAANEALYRDSDLHLVHVMRMQQPLPEADAAAHASASKFGAALLEHAQQVATGLVDGRVHVTSELVEQGAGPVRDLVTRAGEADLIVLQHRDLHGVRRIVTSSTALGVAGRAHAPVVSVPENWRPAEPLHGRVTVGLNDPESSDAALRAGFAIAQQRGAGLRVIHGWWLANGYDAVVVDEQMRQDFSTRFRTAVAPRVDALRGEFPGVAVEVDVHHGQPIAALERAAEDSDLVVLGRRGTTLPLGSHLGPVARAMLRSAPCPVLVVETGS